VERHGEEGEDSPVLGLNAILLAAACSVAFFRPVWGFGIIFLVTSTLFHLDQYLTVPLPVGYIQPTEALLASMIAAAWLKGPGVLPPRSLGGALVPQVRRLSVGAVWLAIGPYCLWQTLCILLGLTHWVGTEHLRFGLRFLLAGVLPWFSLYLLARLSVADGHKVFKTAYYLTLLTAGVHLAIQLTNFRPVMNAAYFWVPENGELDFSGIQQWLDNETFFRGLPQGIPLILFFTLLTVSAYVFARDRRRIRNLTVAVVLFSALFITLTRSLMAVLAAGIIVFVVFASLTGRVNIGGIVRIAGVVSLFVGAALIYDAVRPGFLGFWSQRIEKLSGADSEIFSEDNKARGRDNLAAMSAIGDNPLFGLGTGRYPREYSLRASVPTDTHPMLTIGLVGGIPAMLLILWLQVRLFLPCLKDAFRHPVAASELVPFVSIMIMNTFALNLVGGGGTLSGTPILTVAIFANEMWSRRPPELRPFGRRYVTPRRGQYVRVEPTTDFNPHTIV
jgi:hypothetical protein